MRAEKNRILFRTITPLPTLFLVNDEPLINVKGRQGEEDFEVSIIKSSDWEGASIELFKY